MKSILRVLGIIFYLAVIYIQTASAAELRPLNLPTIQMQQSSQPVYSPYTPQLETTSPEVFDRFKARVKSMTPEEKQSYRKRYNEAFERAEQEGDVVKMSYYRRLLDILYQ